MPVKKIFPISIPLSTKEVKIQVCQVSFPNGCVLYKLYKNTGCFWLAYANGRWKVTARSKPNGKLLVNIINSLVLTTINRHLYKV